MRACDTVAYRTEPSALEGVDRKRENQLVVGDVEHKGGSVVAGEGGKNGQKQNEVCRRPTLYQGDREPRYIIKHYHTRTAELLLIIARNNDDRTENQSMSLFRVGRILLDTYQFPQGNRR